MLHKIYLGEKEPLGAISFLGNIRDLGVVTGPQQTSWLLALISQIRFGIQICIPRKNIEILFKL